MSSLSVPLPRPARTTAFGKIVRNEARLAWRRPVGLLGGIGLPVILLVIFGELPSFQNAASTFDGLTAGLDATGLSSCHAAPPADQRRPLESPGSVSTALQLPCCFEGVLDGTGVASCEVSDDHHVLAVPGRNAEGSGKLPQQPVAVFEIGADHQMGVVKLAGDQPAVVAPLGQPVRHGAAHPGQRLRQPVHLPDQQHRGLPYVPVLTITG
jgi:hypothetical protein